MRNFSKYKRIFAVHFDSERAAVMKQKTEGNFNLEKLALQLFSDSGLEYIRPKLTKGGSRVFAPTQLAGVIENILSIPKPLGPFAVLYKFEPVLKSYHWPVSVQGDVMMAMEKIRAYRDDLAESAAEFLAHSLFLAATPSLKRPYLKRARETYEHLGVPYTEAPLDQKDIGWLLRNGFVAESEIDGNRLRPDRKIKELTKGKLCEEFEGVGNLVSLSEDGINRMVQENKDTSRLKIKRILNFDELIRIYGGEGGHYNADIQLQELAYGGIAFLSNNTKMSGENLAYHDQANAHFNYGVLKSAMGEKQGAKIQFKVAQLINPFDESMDRDIRRVN